MLAYLDHLEARGELDLEQATEFLVLVAALLELKSRLMLPREEEELLELDPGEAAEELLARMLEAKRYRAAAETCALDWRARTASATARRRRRPGSSAPTSPSSEPSTTRPVWAPRWRRCSSPRPRCRWAT